MTTDITELAQRVKTEASAIDDTQWYLAKPSEIRSLVEALEKAQKSNEFLKGQLSELANFNPDWDKLEVSYDSWREIAAELLVAKERIAELESRSVKLPEPFKLAKSSSGLTYYYADEVNEALSAAGIKWEAE
ncbi:hypothetical protein ACEB63_001673 [Raoultella planticola]